MSKTYLTQVEKVQMLVDGLNKHYDMIKNLGISKEQLDTMRQMSAQAMQLNEEVERLRQETSEKIKEANLKLERLKEIWLPIKMKVKSAYDQLKWPMLGIQDKR